MKVMRTELEAKLLAMRYAALRVEGRGLRVPVANNYFTEMCSGSEAGSECDAD